MSDHCQSLNTSLRLVLKTKHYEVGTTDRVSKKITPTVNIYTLSKVSSTVLWA